ncbi:hypothetical protein JCM10212_000819 [Sporobolomyces blumeae]
MQVICSPLFFLTVTFVALLASPGAAEAMPAAGTVSLVAADRAATTPSMAMPNPVGPLSVVRLPPFEAQEGVETGKEGIERFRQEPSPTAGTKGTSGLKIVRQRRKDRDAILVIVPQDSDVDTLDGEEDVTPKRTGLRGQASVESTTLSVRGRSSSVPGNTGTPAVPSTETVAPSRPGVSSEAAASVTSGAIGARPTMSSMTSTSGIAAKVASASSNSTSTIVQSSSTVVIPGRHLAVAPIGLGVVGSVTGVTLLVVAYVLYEKRRYRSLFRSRRARDQSTELSAK